MLAYAAKSSTSKYLDVNMVAWMYLLLGYLLVVAKRSGKANNSRKVIAVCRKLPVTVTNLSRLPCCQKAAPRKFSSGD